jgi:hypothetical protein
MKLLSLTALVLAAGPVIALTASDTGLSGAALSGGATTSTINMLDAIETNQLALKAVVTAGTTTAVRVSCEESEDGSTWGYIPVCDSSSPVSACVPDVREFTLSSGTEFVTRWPVAQQYVRCTFEDPSAGTGTVTVTGSRSAQ